MEEKKYTSIKDFGFDPEIIKKQNDAITDEEQKLFHIQKVYGRVIELRQEIMTIVRYYGCIMKKIRQINIPYENAISKKKLLEEIEKIDKDYISNYTLERITKRFEREIKDAINEIYYNSYKKVSKRVENKESRVIILETLFDGLNEKKANQVIRSYTNELRQKDEELRKLMIWLNKEKTKLNYLNSFKIDESDFAKQDSKSKLLLIKFGRNELQKNLKVYINEYKLKEGVTVPQTVVRKITKSLTKSGYDAKETSVAEALRKMGYVEGLRK